LSAESQDATTLPLVIVVEGGLDPNNGIVAALIVKTFE
jgi:hypothetical protein